MQNSVPKDQQLTKLPIQQCQFIYSSMIFHCSFQFDSILQSHFPLQLFNLAEIHYFENSKFGIRKSYKIKQPILWKKISESSFPTGNFFSASSSPILTLFIPLFGRN
ncbi:unnamed protein product [Citrullus colocynthis]|uniref:Uncharacterized protein n=1 Tax=Citrullus colocynthis TaxID=252529 RepID=A0ABP0Z1J0_9ROSI